MNLFRLGKEILIKHIVVWVILETILQILSPLPGTIPIMILSGLIILTNTIFTFYFLGLYILPKYWGNYFHLTMGILFSYIIYSLLYYLIGYHLLPIIGGGSNMAKGNLVEFLKNTILLYLMISTCATAFYLYRQSIFGLKTHNEKEKQLISKELNLLKGQFNNHLTFNFLNFCYSHVHQYSRSATASVELFSDMLRNSLDLPIGEKILLQQEVEYIKNYIRLQQIISTNYQVDFICKGHQTDKFIVPHLLVSFIDENLKHCDFNHNGKAVFVELNPDNECLELKIACSPQLIKNNKITEEATVQKVFDLFYNNKYKIAEEWLPEQYIKKLTLYW
jgi:hypothetical protein